MRLMYSSGACHRFFSGSRVPPIEFSQTAATLNSPYKGLEGSLRSGGEPTGVLLGGWKVRVGVGQVSYESHPHPSHLLEGEGK